MESCSNQKSVKQIKIYILDSSMYPPFSLMTALYTLGILSTNFTWNAFPTVLKESWRSSHICWAIVGTHILLHASWWEPHMQKSSIHLLFVSQRHGGWNPNSQIWTHQTIGQISTGLMSIAHVSWAKQVSYLLLLLLLLLLVSISSGFFAAIWPWRPDSCSLFWTVDVEMCLLPELCEAFFWAAISEAGNS